MDSLGKFTKDRIVIGFDVSDDYSLISYYSLAEKEPVTVGTVVGGDDICIPTVLGKYYAENKWIFGRDALQFLDRKEGTVITNLLSRAREGKKVEVELRDYNPIDLLALFMKKCFALLAVSAPIEKVSAVIITVDRPDAETIDIFLRAIDILRIKPEKVYFQSHSESAYEYIINQNKEIWKNEVVICHMKSDCLYVRKMHKVQRTSPTVVLMEENTYKHIKSTDFIDATPEILKQKDAEFEYVMKGTIEGSYVSAIFLIGDEFSGEWWKDSLAYMSRNRRVFIGNNLFSKGAAYGARERISPSERASEYVFLGKDKVKANVGMRVVRGGEEVYMALLDAGQNWYETKKECQLILDREEVLEFVITPLNGKDVKTGRMYLSGMPVRPRKATRIQLELKMVSERKLSVTVTDMGFGEFFEASGQYWTTEFILE